MRIIAGIWGGQRIQAPTGNFARPTLDRVREAMGSLLEARSKVAGARVLDLFAGSGALGFEMLSRGASYAVLAELHPEALRCIRHNAVSLGATSQVRVLAADLLHKPGVFAKHLEESHEAPFDLVLADPPYDDIDALPPLLLTLQSRQLLAPQATILVEHATRKPPASWGTWWPVASYRYGDSALQLLTPQA